MRLMLAAALVLVLAMSVWAFAPIGLGSIGQDPPERLPMVGGEPAPILFLNEKSGTWKRNPWVDAMVAQGRAGRRQVSDLANRGVPAEEILRRFGSQ